MLNTSGRSREIGLALVATVAVCAYLLAFRVHDISHSFPLLAEQERDWSIAQRVFADLPWVGPRSVTSGIDIGPVYYWFLWAGRVLLGPFFGFLPHTGGWAIAIFETLSDGVLLVALWCRLGSWGLAAAIVVFGATGALGASLSAVVWNPPVAEAFAKLATASVLWPGASSVARSALTTVLAVCAVQCHVSSVSIAIPLVGWSLWALGRARGLGAMATAALIGVLALAPWGAPYMLRPDAAPAIPQGPGVSGSLADVVRDPVGRFRLLASADATADALEALLLVPFHGSWLRYLMVAGAVVLVVRMRDGALLAASMGPLVTAVALFSLWQGRFGEVYWFLSLIPAAVVCLAAPVIVLTHRRRVWGVALLCLVTLALQPARAQTAWTVARQPAYGPIAIGVTTAAANARPVRAVQASFDLPTGMDPLFMFSLAGGRLDPAAPVALLIAPDGTIRYVPFP